MNTHQEKTSEEKNQAAADRSSKKRTNGQASVQFSAKQPAVAAQQEMVNNSPQVSQLRYVQQMADNGARVKQIPGTKTAGAKTIQQKKQTVPGHFAQANAPVQLVASQISMGSEEGKIERISIVGRPPRAHSGTMGDHTTAFTTLATSISTRLSGKSIEETFFLVINLYSDMKKLPGMDLVDNMPKEQKIQLKEAFNNLEGLLDKMYTRYKDRGSLGLEKMPYTGHDVTLVQNLIDAFLEARELVPLSTINTKALNAALAGKGKGESAGKLAKAEKGQSVSGTELVGTILGLFDARSAAVVAEIKDQELMNKVAPGMSVEIHADKRKDMMIRQHIQSIVSLYPVAWKSMSETDQNSIYGSMLLRINEKMEQNKKVREEGQTKKERKGGSPRDPNKRYVATSLQVDDNNLIGEIKVEGRTPSPFSGTMGAHTTAWTLLVERIRVELKGCTTLQAATKLRDISSAAEKHLLDSAEIFQADTKQLHKLIWGMKEIIEINKKLDTIKKMAIEKKVEKGYSAFEVVLVLQEVVNQILNLQNLTPGASLYVGNTNGAREGAYRGILVGYRDRKEGSRELVRKAVLGLLDLKSLDEHISTMQKTIEEEQDDEEDDSREEYEKEFYKEILALDKRPKADVKRSVIFLVKHHFELIKIAFPGALEYAGIKEDEEQFLKLAEESLLYSTDEEFEPDEEEE